MTALGHGTMWTLCSYVVGKVTTIIASYLLELFPCYWPSLTSPAIFTSSSNYHSGLYAFVRGLTFKLHLFTIPKTAESFHLDHTLVDEDVSATIVGGYKSEAFDDVEPFTLARLSFSCSFPSSSRSSRRTCNRHVQ